MTREEILTATSEWLNEQIKIIAFPNYNCDGLDTETLDDAWKVVDLMHKNGDYLSLEYQAGVLPEISKLGWIAKFRHSGVYAVGETVPEAICKAFLLAMEPGN